MFDPCQETLTYPLIFFDLRWTLDCCCEWKFTFKSLSETSLKQVKAAIAASEKLGNIPIAQQRIFHLGRELKTLGRSLESLGVGRMGITVLHVHAVPSNNYSTEVQPANTVPPRRRQQKASSSLRPPNAECINPASASEVVDLAGDDVDEDNDDGVVVLDEIAPSRSQRRRQRRRVG